MLGFLLKKVYSIIILSMYFTFLKLANYVLWISLKVIDQLTFMISKIKQNLKQIQDYCVNLEVNQKYENQLVKENAFLKEVLASQTDISRALMMDLLLTKKRLICKENDFNNLLESIEVLDSTLYKQKINN